MMNSNHYWDIIRPKINAEIKGLTTDGYKLKFADKVLEIVDNEIEDWLQLEYSRICKDMKSNNYKTNLDIDDLIVIKK